MPAPTSPVTLSPIATPGRMMVEATSGGSAATSYTIQIASNIGMTTDVQTVTGPSSKAVFANLVPGTTYHARSYASNGSGSSAYSAVVAAIPQPSPALGTLDYIEFASIVVDGSITVSLRSDGATVPTITLGYSKLLDGTTWTLIATIPTGAAPDFGNTGGGRQDFALVTDTVGNLFVIGRRGTTTATLIKRYSRTATTTWVASGLAYQSISGTIPLGFSAVFVAGVGVSPRDSILVVQNGVDGAKAPVSHAWATIDLAAVAASSATPFINSGETGSTTWGPTWLPSYGDSLDLRRMTGSANRIVGYSRNFTTVFDVTNGAEPVMFSRAAPPDFSSFMEKSRALVIDVNTIAIVQARRTDGLRVVFYTTSGTLLGSATYAAANFQGATVTDQWDAYFEPVSGQVRIYYIADDSTRKIERVDVNPATFAISALTVVTSTFGAASSTNGKLRIPRGPVDERRIFLEGANLLAGVKSVAVFSDTVAEVAPNAPAIADIAAFDATAAYLFTWIFGDPNVNDAQTAYELQIQRVSDSVDVVATGKITSAVSSRSVAGGTLTNGIAYRWRVRTYDAQDTVGAWSAYDAFSTSATGTLTITSPAADNPVGLNTSTIPITWSYTQPNGYVQTQRRVRVIRVSDSAVLSDTTMQASVATSYNVPAVPSGVPVRIELTIVTNAPGTPTIGPTNRLLTTTYASPTVPTAVLVADVSCIVITTTNPAPTGDEPLPAFNLVERRLGGTADAFVAIASIAPNGAYRDHAVKSATQYEYRIRAVTA